MTELRPSEIRYSQSTISTVFDRRCQHPRKPIEDTLENICEGRQTIDSIPSITVCQHNGQWYTIDNRRLWVFKHPEALGKCTTIKVKQTERSNVPNKKFTTSNEGISVGFYYRYASVPSRYWFRAAETQLTVINDRITHSASTPRNEAETSSESDSIISNNEGSCVEINSNPGSSNSSSNDDCIPKTESQKDSTIKIFFPDNEEDSSLNQLDECKDQADRKDASDNKLQSNDQRSDQVHQLDQYQKEDQGQSQNDVDVVSHTQESIKDQNFNQQLEVSQAGDPQIQEIKEIMEFSVRTGENSLKRSHVGVEEEYGNSNSKIRRTEEGKKKDL
ncbi:hypothetical protein CHS0354_014855 [Potamilus streckersoni]|uniref:Uncharacterized protein n=1 Tax=Potamilus streckersoni TaxID=2493646 RepID=A0AAE0VE70_9BIVA|nr:hypothetical protein CHS0354_014855 [Potamilus streckersoni]